MIKRYDPYYYDGYGSGMDEWSKGDWVSYDDILPILKAARTLAEAWDCEDPDCNREWPCDACSAVNFIFKQTEGIE